MTIVNEFDYFKPADYDELFNILGRYKNPSILAGGTDLAVNLKHSILNPDVVVDIKGINDLKKIYFSGNSVYIGALATFSEIIESKLVVEKIPVLMESAHNVACVGIRNRATMAGNLCSCVPCMDSAPVLCCYDASVLLLSKAGERILPLNDFFLGPRRTILKKNEIVKAIVVPYPKAKHAGCFVKLKRYAGEDLAQASASVIVFDDDTYSVAFGSVAPVPKRARSVEEALNGKKIYNGKVFDEEAILRASAKIDAEISPITDIRATKEYRFEMAKTMFERGLKEAFLRLAGKGSEYGNNILNL